MSGTGRSEARVLAPEDPDWRAVLARAPHDIYHLPELALLEAAVSGGRACALHSRNEEGELLVPLVLRGCPNVLSAGEGWSDAASPYGYAGPVVVGAPRATALAALILGVREEALARGMISLFIRMHPLLNTECASWESVGSVVDHGPTVAVDLSKPVDEIRSGFRKAHRYEIRRSRRAGFSVTVDEWDSVGEFSALYRKTMSRIGASEDYDRDTGYFNGLRALRGASVRLLLARAPSGEVAAGALFSECHGVWQYLYSAAGDAFRNMALTKLIIDEAILLGSGEAGAIMHLGGGVGSRDDSLFDFKAGFSDLRLRYRTCRIATEPVVFSSLISEWEAECEGGERGEDDQFFPPYCRVQPNRR